MLGLVEGTLLGPVDGNKDGKGEGFSVEGPEVGSVVGIVEGFVVGEPEGTMLGDVVGNRLGYFVGTEVKRDSAGSLVAVPYTHALSFCAFPNVALGLKFSADWLVQPTVTIDTEFDLMNAAVSPSIS